MAPSTILGDPGAYLVRARAMHARGEALGARLVAWSAAVFAMAFDLESAEEAIALATSIREDSTPAGAIWAAGIAEGHLEPLFPDDPRSHLSWGDALLASVSLARVAKPGEVLVDVDLRAMQEGQLGVVEIRSATDSGRRVRGWRVDLGHPWTTGEAARAAEPGPADGARPADGEFAMGELSTAEVLEIVDSDSGPGLAPLPTDAENAASPRAAVPWDGPFGGAFGAGRGRSGTSLLVSTVPRAGATDPGGASTREFAASVPGAMSGESSPSSPPPHGATLARLARQVRAIALRRSSADALAALPALRRACADAGEEAPETRCRGGLSLAVALAVGGLPEDALLEALEALALARESRNDEAAAACLALLSKLYDYAAWPDAASRLHELALERQTLVPPPSVPMG